MKLFRSADKKVIVSQVLGSPESFSEIKAGTTDAAQEKHVPVIERNGNKVKVKVGSVAHPMDEDHWITDIWLVQGNKTQLVKLNPGEAPEAEFDVEDGAVSVYEYCNKHGLWKAEG